MDPKPVGLSPRSTVRGRPRTTSTRNDPCARCGRNIPRLAAHVARRQALLHLLLRRDPCQGNLSDTGMSITLGQHPTDVPEPFASLLREHLAARPNLRTGAGPDSPWLFPSTLAGRHLHPNHRDGPAPRSRREPPRRPQSRDR